MRIDLVLAGPIVFERPEQATLRDPEWRRIQSAGHDGRLDVRVLLGVAHFNGEITGVQFDILAAADLLDRERSKGHAHVQVGLARNLDPDLKFIADRKSTRLNSSHMS